MTNTPAKLEELVELELNITQVMSVIWLNITPTSSILRVNFRNLIGDLINGIQTIQEM